MRITVISVFKTFDYIPVISTVSNAVALFQKYQLDHCDVRNSRLASYRTDALRDLYVVYLKNKSILRCVALLIPVIGNIIIGVSDALYTLRLHAVCRKPQNLALCVLRRDIHFLKLPVSYNSQVLQFVDEDLKKNEDFLIEIIRHSPAAIQIVDESLKKDKDFLLKAIAANPQILLFLSEKQSNDPALIYFAVKLNPLTIEYAGDKLKNNAEFMLAILRLNPFCNPELQRLKLECDMPFLLNLMRTDNWASRYISLDIQNGRKTVIYSSNDVHEARNAWNDIILYVRERFRNDRDFMSRAEPFLLPLRCLFLNRDRFLPHSLLVYHAKC